MEAAVQTSGISRQFVKCCSVYPNTQPPSSRKQEKTKQQLYTLTTTERERETAADLSIDSYRQSQTVTDIYRLL